RPRHTRENETTMSMTLKDLTPREPFLFDNEPPALARLLQAARRAIAAYAARRAMRQAEAELMALDDRALKDSGLVRPQIQSALMDRANLRDRIVRSPGHRF